MYQLGLPVQLRPEWDFSAYVAGPNAEAVAAVSAWATGAGDAFLYLFGIAGSGKTHLLQAACREAVRGNFSAIYLPLKHPDLATSVLDDLELQDLIALDDVQAIAGQPCWEHALFDLYNRLREAGRRLLVSADAPASRLPFTLADLRSRLGWGPGYRLLTLSEGDCERLLRQSADHRGLALGAEVIRYIMRRCPREPAFLMELLEEIDRESLRMQRRPSLWLVRQIMETRES
jgi:DnaA family protein